jgi:hypothetical protein
MAFNPKVKKLLIDTFLALTYRFLTSILHTPHGTVVQYKTILNPYHTKELKHDDFSLFFTVCSVLIYTFPKHKQLSVKINAALFLQIN